MPSFAGLSKFFGRTASEGAAFAAGIAVSPALSPVVREVVNEANAKYQTHPLGVGDLAEIVAEDVQKQPWGEDEAAKNGFSPGNFDALLGSVLNAPDLGTLYRAWRRDEISDGDFLHGLRKARLEPRWDESMQALKSERLAPEVVARAIQRSLIRDPGLLPVAQPTATGKVPAFPVFNIDAEQEAKAWGIDLQRLGVELGLIGNPMGPHEAAQAVFRGVIDPADYDRAVAEGNTRLEWGPAIFEQSRAIPSVTNYVEARLRGWIDDAAMFAGAARHGMTEEDTQLEFLIHGRPLVHNQVFIGLLRGGVYDGPTAAIPAPFLKSLQESNVRPEWYNLIWAGRYHYPPFFQTVNALNKGWIDAATATRWLTVQAYEPDAIKTIGENVAGSKTAPADTRIKSAQTTLVTSIHKAYVGGAIDDAGAQAQLASAGLDAQTVAGILEHWRQEKALEATAAPPAA